VRLRVLVGLEAAAAIAVRLRMLAIAFAAAMTAAAAPATAATAGSIVRPASAAVLAVLGKLLRRLPVFGARVVVVSLFA
jgi:hypothetical protein